MIINVYSGYSAFYNKSKPRKYNSIYQFLSEKWNGFSEEETNEIKKSYQTKENWIKGTEKAIEKQVAASRISIAIFGKDIIQILQ